MSRLAGEETGVDLDPTPHLSVFLSTHGSTFLSTVNTAFLATLGTPVYT